MSSMDLIYPGVKWIVDIFKKTGVEYQISGGFAAHLYGAKRPINDVDIDIKDCDFDKLFDFVGNFVSSFGPYKDSRWDLENRLILSFYGQKIDIGGDCKIFNDSLRIWIESPIDFSKTRDVLYKDLMLKVIDPFELIEYKLLLKGKHQVHDIFAVKDEISNSGFY